MHRTRTILSSLAVVAAALGATGCSSSSTGSDGGGGLPTNVSFSKDVMPIFQQSCTLSNVCHGQMFNSAEENLYLGDNIMNTADIINQVYTGLVGVPALEDPKMSLVTAGDASKSYITYKDNGTQDMLASDCAMVTPLCPSPSCTASAPCGALMPYTGVIIDQNLRDTIEGWIAEGAKNN
jgi:hypothetical protein